MATKRTDLNIRYLDIDKLIPYANNARTHSDEQVSQIAASIKEFGFNNPVLIDADKGIIAGHGRVLAAKKLGLTEVPTIELSHLSDTQRKAYILADNKLAENAGWDNDLLKIEIEELRNQDFELTGFSPDELDIIENGWESNFKDPGEYEHDDAVKEITIKCGAMDYDHAKEVITNALDAAGIEYEF